jgi:hypothetical protein
VTRYLYLALGLILLIPAVGVAILRRDLRRAVITVALIGAAWGPISEIWFFRDYWHPASVLGSPLLEDMIYGAGIVAVASCIYKVVAQKTYVPLEPHRTHYPETGAVLVLYIGSMAIFSTGLGVNSILVAIGVYMVAAAYIIVRRHDLLIPSVSSAILMGLIAVFGYGIGLNYLVPEPTTLAHIWLLYKKPLGLTVLGYVPVTEVAWYAAWGALLGVLYEFATGNSLTPLKRASRMPDGKAYGTNATDAASRLTQER